MLDVGGGSTEYAAGDGPLPEDVVSCEIGAVRLTEAVPALAGGDAPVGDKVVEQARAAARDALAPLAKCAAVERLALVGGSATTAAAIVRGRATPAGTQPLTRADLQRTLERLLGMNLEERRVVTGMKPQRADILPAGIVLIDTAMEVLGKDEAVATTADLLLGVLLQERDAVAGQRPPPRAGSKTQRGMRP